MALGVTAHEVSGTDPSEARPRPGAQGDLSELQASALARSSGKPVEATARRSGNINVYALPNGQYSERIYTKNIRVRRNGRWTPISTKLVRNRSGWTTAATDLGITFSAGSREATVSRGNGRVALTAPRDAATGANPLVSVVEDGHTVDLAWPGPVPAPIVDGSRALYPEILPGVDLVLTAHDDSVGELLVLKTAAAAASPAVAQLDYLLSSPDLQFHLDATTSQVNAVDQSGTQVLSTASPLMWDSAGAGATVGVDGPAPSATATDAASATTSASDSASASPLADPLPGMPAFPTPTSSDEPPTAPASASPSPTATPHSGAAATLDLPGLDGPSAESHGALVGTQLDASGDLRLTPDQALLTDAGTVYPVFVDPTIYEHKDEWALVYKKYPDSHFINGANYNNGTDEARVGFESTTWGTSRAYFNLQWDPKLKGATVNHVTFYALETYAWSCTKESFDIGYTGLVTSATTWNNQPGWGSTLATPSTALGRSSCPQDWVSTADGTLKTVAQNAANGGWTHIGIGLRSTNETDPYYWKKFQANGDYTPYFKVDFDHPPTPPTGLDTDPGSGCTTSGTYQSIGKSDITFHATATDPDGLSDLDSIYLIVGKSLVDSTGKRTIDNNNLVFHNYVPVTSAGAIAKTIAQTSFTNGVTYAWAAAAKDKSGASSAGTPKGTYCFFTYDNTAPSSPKVASTDFPPPGDDGSIWSPAPLGTAGAFTFTSPASDAAVKYQYSFDTPSYANTVTAVVDASKAASYSLTGAKPPAAGPNVLYVRALDAAGNVSSPARYLFNVTPNSKSGKPGDTTGDGFPDLYVIDGDNALQLYTSDGKGNLSAPVRADYHHTADGGTGPDPSVDWTGALITHLGDYYGGDGIQDLVARMNDGRLWIYPGDGYGGFDTDRRREVLLPANAPAPSTFTQIVSLGDVTGDGRPELLAIVGNTLWAFTGYAGGSFSAAQQIGNAGWSALTIHSAGDITGDGAVDLLLRNTTTGALTLRPGTKTANGTDITSLGAPNGDISYGTNWSTANVRLIDAVPDANGDTIPDLWVVMADGSIRFYAATRTNTTAGAAITPLPPSGGWSSVSAIG